MYNIRPNQVFQLVAFEDEQCWFQVPNRGGLMTLESMVLISLMKAVNAKFIFEFGTYKGFTTRLFLENLRSCSGKNVFTLDLPSYDGVKFQGNDKNLAIESLGYNREYLNSDRKNHVEQIYADSIKFNFIDFVNKFDLIFIDANHMLEYVKSDTENSLKMLSHNGVIIWHDYGNRDFPELKNYLDQLSNDINIYHIEETMMCFYAPKLCVPKSL